MSKDSFDSEFFRKANSPSQASSIYEIYKLNPPIKDGQRYRGNSSAEEYWRGFDNHRSLSPSKSSVSYQAYKSGKDAREKS
tara:strand:+ start:900 stop:1142 length:243 start_codon:yes stop_codon:yes gene_type:complete